MRPYWKSPCGRFVVYHADCQTIQFDQNVSIITDPPYGISYNAEDVPQAKHVKSHRRQVAKVRGDDAPFDPSRWLTFKRVVLWGYSCFADKLPLSPALLCWDKVTRNGTKLRIAEFELAWAKPLRRSQMFRWLWSGSYRVLERSEHYHPTQKPVPLMKWCMDVVGVPADSWVVDPYMGSGSTGVACVQSRRCFIGVELERDYCDVAVNRISAALQRPGLCV